MLRLAWRNVWRNGRRSAINIAAMGFGLAAIMFGQSLKRSLQRQLVEKATGSLAGHVCIQRGDIDDPRLPDKFMENPEAAARVMADDPRVLAWGRRLQLTGLISSPKMSIGALLCGVEPEKERRITDMAGYINEGSYIKDGENGIVVGRKLARRLDVRRGEKVVLMAQAADGSMGAEVFRVVGVSETGSEAFDGQMAWITLRAMQKMLGRPGQANQLTAKLNDVGEAAAVAADFNRELGPGNVRAVTWRELEGEVVGIQDFEDGVLAVILVVVFATVALGVLNTQLMSLFERVREFGVLMAMGARPSWIVRLLLFESALLGLLGTALGVAVGAAAIAHYGRRGLPLPVGDAIKYFLPFPSVIYLRPAWGPHAFAGAAVFLIALLATLPPALRAGRLKPAEALRHV
ncbi:MAG: ABC transporter permease [Elusimicrobiota bacterium]